VGALPRGEGPQEVPLQHPHRGTVPCGVRRRHLRGPTERTDGGRQSDGLVTEAIDNPSGPRWPAWPNPFPKRRSDGREWNRMVRTEVIKQKRKEKRGCDPTGAPNPPGRPWGRRRTARASGQRSQRVTATAAGAGRESGGDHRQSRKKVE